MNTGMLWLDDDPKRTLAQKIERARAYYWEMRGLRFDVVHVHPTTLGPEATPIPGLRLVPDRTVLPNHYWFGQAQEATHGQETDARETASAGRPAGGTADLVPPAP